jgi:hypothetical protein
MNRKATGKPTLKPKKAALKEQGNRPTGRPSSFTPEIGKLICDRMVEGESLIQICKGDDMPERKTIYRWMDSHDAFRREYARAREGQAAYYADLIRQVAFDDSGDFFIQDGKMVSDHARVQRARLQVDALKWTAARMFPKDWGDRLATEVSGPNGGPVQNMTISWQAAAPLPPPAPAPQLTYDPGPLPSRFEGSIIEGFARMVKATVPRADQRSPEEVLEEVLAISEAALRTHYGNE